MKESSRRQVQVMAALVEGAFDNFNTTRRIQMTAAKVHLIMRKQIVYHNFQKFREHAMSCNFVPQEELDRRYLLRQKKVEEEREAKLAEAQRNKEWAEAKVAEMHQQHLEHELMLRRKLNLSDLVSRPSPSLFCSIRVPRPLARPPPFLPAPLPSRITRSCWRRTKMLRRSSRSPRSPRR